MNGFSMFVFKVIIIFQKVQFLSIPAYKKLAYYEINNIKKGRVLMAGEKVAVIGGGISGLCTALALQRKGIRAEVYERNKTADMPDSGMILGGNALICLELLGLSPAMSECSLGTNEYNIKADSGKLISTLKYSSPALATCFRFFSGIDFLRILAGSLAPGTLHYGKKLADFKQHKNGVRLYFRDGTMEECTYMIACDGCHSTVRSRVISGHKPVFSGYTCWRGILEHDKDLGECAFSETWGPRGRFGIVPLPGNRLYWYAVKNSEGHSEAMAKWTSIDLLFNFFYYHDPIQQILERVKDEEILNHDLYEFKPISRFLYNHILLLGDAAHSSIPNIGQGASQAIEDAVMLANTLAESESLEEGFLSYSEHRPGHLRKVSSTIKNFGKVAQIEMPALCTIRNNLLRLAPTSFHSRRLGDIFEIHPCRLSSSM